MTHTTENTTDENTTRTSDLRPAMIGELARAEAATASATSRIAELEAEIERLRTEQIIDGADPRLERFWERAGRIADYADYCSEYDRMAEELNGPARERDYTVELTIDVRITYSTTTRATSEEEAVANVENDLDTDTLIEHGSVEEWEVRDSSAERE